MAIKGLAEKVKVNESPNGKFVRLGRLNKGEREGFGKNIKIYDLDYFRFTPYAEDPGDAQAMSDLFIQCYGEKPKVIDPVFLPVNISGEFDITDNAWLMAQSYSENRPPVFLGLSDGEWIYRLRENNKSVKQYAAGDLPYTAVTKDDQFGNASLVINNKLYPWQQRITLELILPDFNDALYRAGLAGYGVISFSTSSVWDVSTLIQEYYGILGTVADAFCNPFIDGDRDRWLKRVPLREIPLRLYRQVAQITRPDPKSDDPLARYKKPTSLSHLQISPQYAGAIARAHEYRSKLWLKMTAINPLLSAGHNPDLALAQANADLFGTPSPAAQAFPDTASAWKQEFAAVDTVIEASFTETAQAPRLGSGAAPKVIGVTIDDDDFLVEGEPIKEPKNQQVRKAKRTQAAQAPEQPPRKAVTAEQGQSRIKRDQPAQAAQPPEPPLDPEAALDPQQFAKMAMNAKTADQWAAAVYSFLNTGEHKGTFTNAAGAKKFLGSIVGDLNEYDQSWGQPGLVAAQTYAQNRQAQGQKKALEMAAVAFFDVKSAVDEMAAAQQGDEEE